MGTLQEREEEEEGGEGGRGQAQPRLDAALLCEQGCGVPLGQLPGAMKCLGGIWGATVTFAPSMSWQAGEQGSLELLPFSM